MTEDSRNERLRALPKVEEVLRHPLVEPLTEQYERPIVVGIVRDAIEAARETLLADPQQDVDVDAIVADVFLRALRLQRPSLHRVINASGVIVHTNLGRSVLADSAVDAVCEAARNYSTLEYDTANLTRGSRHVHYEQLICSLTGAEAALAVNNNAAAVMMVLSEFASEREAIVSRGELVEIGGSFRIPDIMALSQAQMVEVGTTNKTRLSDYEQALGPQTAMLLKVHPSNYRLVGFTETVNTHDLRKLADEEIARRTAADEDDAGELLVYEDQGSGTLIHLDCFGDAAEPTVTDSLHAGCDLVSFSGDKLLGGPQAGIIVGKKCYIDRLKENPLARALRLDKMTIAALEATLRLYLDPEQVLKTVPTLSMLSTPAADLKPRAEALASAIKETIPQRSAKVSVVDEVARCGGGALPTCDIDSFAVCVEFNKGDALDCERFLVNQREVPVIGRIKNEALLFDVRTLIAGADCDEIATALAAYFDSLKRSAKSKTSSQDSKKEADA